MKLITRFSAFFAVFLFVLLQAAPAFADYQNEAYYFKSYDVSVNVLENNTYEITETISAYFNEERHGIYRTIPYVNTVSRTDGTQSSVRAKIAVQSVSEDYTLERTSDSYTLKIGNENTLISGEHSYVISYEYELGEDANDGFDEFYFNLIGDAWDVYIENVSFDITMPKEFDSDRLGFSTGSYGTVGTDEVSYSVNGSKITGELTDTLEPYTALTVRLELDDGYFYFNRALYNAKLAFMVIIPCAALFAAVILYFKFGKDKKPVETVEFYPPENMSCADVAFWKSGKAENKNIVPLLIELANEGYLEINEIKGKKNDFELVAVKEKYDGGDRKKEIFFNGLFNGANRRKVTKDELRCDFYMTIDIIREIYNSAESRYKVFNKNSLYMRILSWVITAASFAGVIILLASFTAIKQPVICFAAAGMAICLLSFVLAFFIRKRTDKAVDILGKINGFKTFLETAEKERLEMLVNDDPKYFYNILSYAYVLGVSDKWTKKFEDMAPEAPQWYHSARPYDYVVFGSFLRRTMIIAENVMLETPQSSQSIGSGGFSSGGGGFAGGGVGGGGGGSW